MPKENKGEFDKDFKEVLVKIRYPDDKEEDVSVHCADLLCRKAGCVDVVKEAAEKAAKEAKEAEKKEKE